MDFVALFSNAFSAGAGAFAGAFAAYFLACHQENLRTTNEYLSLLLLVHEYLDAVYKLLVNIPPELVKEVDGQKVVEFQMPFPDFTINTQQMQSLFKVAPDKQMPSALIQFNHFLKMHSRRISKSGSAIYPLAYVQQQITQLKFMLLSVRVQYEQQSNAAFPLE